MVKDLDRKELLTKLNLTHRGNFRTNYLLPALTMGLIEMTMPDSPNNPQQRYRLTSYGEKVRQRLQKAKK